MHADPDTQASAPAPRNATELVRARSAKSRRIAWALAGVVALLYALAFLINR